MQIAWLIVSTEASRTLAVSQTEPVCQAPFMFHDDQTIRSMVSLDPKIPRGFKVGSDTAGYLTIEYRQPQRGCATLFFAVWISGWTVGCILMTWEALFNAGNAPAGVPFLVVPFWMADVFVCGLFTWFVLSVTRFVLEPDHLFVERSAVWYSRRRIFRRNSISAIQLVRSESDGTTDWSLVIFAGSGVGVLANQAAEQGEWLGAILAQWADVPFEPAPTGPIDSI